MYINRILLALLLVALGCNISLAQGSSCSTQISINGDAPGTGHSYARNEILEIQITNWFQITGQTSVTIDFGDIPPVVIDMVTFGANAGAHNSMPIFYHTYTGSVSTPTTYTIKFSGALCGEFPVTISPSNYCCEGLDFDWLSPARGYDASVLRSGSFDICTGQQISIGLKNGCDLSQTNNVHLQNVDWVITDMANPSNISYEHGPVLTHTFTSVGTYSIQCSATYSLGSDGSCSKTDLAMTINVVGSLDVDLATIYNGCKDHDIHFQPGGNLSIVDSYTWDFGDYSASEQGSPVTHSYGVANDYTVSCTVTSNVGCASTTITAPVHIVPDVDIEITSHGFRNCTSFPQFFDFNVLQGNADSWTWDFGDPSSPNNTSTDRSPSHTFTSPGTYLVTCTVYTTTYCESSHTEQLSVTIDDCPPPCPDCIGSFSPLPDKEYVLSAWVSEQSYHDKILFTEPEIYLDFTNGTPATLGPFKPKPGKPIIDGWQQIEEPFTIPTNATEIKVRLVDNGTEKVYFDDIRIYPFDGTMKSFVYDPISLKLVAELDERNFATFYEYDSEGNLVRVKKETERGIKTIQESRSSSPKQP